MDRFAASAHTPRQSERASKNRLRSIYTPQVVRNGRDWPQWGGAESRISVSPETARVHITTVLVWYETFSEFISAVKYR